MIKHLSKILMICAVFFLFSCQDDSSEFVPNGSEIIEGNNLIGLVQDENKQALENVRVVFQGMETFTDEFGFYTFKDVDLDSRHNFVSITKDGFFEGARTFRTNSSTTLSQVTTLIRKDFDYSFNASAGGSVDEGTISLTFPTDAIVVESNNTDYSGEVRVAVHYLDPTAQSIVEQMPGDMSAVDADENYVTLSSFGMAYVELESPSGEKLQIKDGQKVEMRGKVPSSSLSSAPSEIKMWFFDEVAGLWQEEGSATLVGDEYVGEVSHFSCWNYDGPAPTIILCGRVVDQNGNPLGGVHVWVETQAFFGVGHGNTNPNGTFCGAVSKDELLTILIQNIPGCQDPVNLGDFGPYSVDTDLGDLVIDLGDDNTVTVTGTAVDCDGNPLSNGVVVMNGSNMVEITDGTFEITQVSCANNEAYSLKVIDLDGQVESETITVTGGGNIDVGQIDACVNEIFRLEMNSTALGINYVGLHELFAFQDSLSSGGLAKSFFGYYVGPDDVEQASANFKYDDGNDSDFVTGTFNLLQGSFWKTDNVNPNGIAYNLTNGTVTIEEVNDLEKYIKGNYTSDLIDAAGNNIDLSGDFKLNFN